MKKRIAVGWTIDKVRAVSNAAMMERLEGLGIGTSADEFVEQARSEHAAGAMAEAWRARFPVTVHGFDDDFIDLAVCVLCERLLARAAQLRDAG